MQQQKTLIRSAVKLKSEKREIECIETLSFIVAVVHVRFKKQARVKVVPAV